MITTNLWRRLRQLLPESPLLVGTVIATSTYGATVQLPDGALLQVRGDASIGDKVFVRAGRIEGPAPALTSVLIEI
jgi:hypothetical protein